MGVAEGLDDPRSAVARGDWHRALDLLDDGAEDLDPAERLELRAQAAYGTGDFETSVAAWEDQHALLVDRGDVAGGARAAAMVAMFLMIDSGLMAPVRGWLRRAERLLGDADEGPSHAVIAMVRAYERFMCGDMDAANHESARAIELGERFDVTPAVVVGRTASARVQILTGDVDGGLALLDEVGALLMSGEVDPLTTGMMYCELICAAQGLALHDMATEWTDVMDHWRHDAAFGGLSGRCRVHRAELLRMSGPCDVAEQEALAACDELRPWMRREFGWPLAELGTIRLRKGDLEGAEEAYLAAHEHAWTPHPGLALLRLAQGDPACAMELINESIAHPWNIPSKERPPFGDLRMAPLLDAQALIAAAMGDAATAAHAAAGLEGIAASYPSASLAACSALASARAALASGDLEPAADRAAAAVAGWTEIGAPFEAASARLVLGEIHERAGNPEAARLEWRAAEVAFEAFGAVREAARAAGLVEGVPVAVPSAPTLPRGGARFACRGDTRDVTFAEMSVVVRDLKGMRYLERLLGSPGREFHVLDLVAVEQGSLPTRHRDDDGLDEVAEGVGGGLPVLDDEAREAYRRRLIDVDEDIEDALERNDIGRAELARRDRDYLLAELSRAVGLGGSHRTTGGTAERARTSVTRSIRYAIARLAEQHPAAAQHLERSVSTGTYCVYEPDPVAAVSWEI